MEVEDDMACSEAAESIQEIKEDASTYTGCLRGRSVPFVKVQLCCFCFGTHSHSRKGGTVLCNRTAKAMVGTLIRSLVGELLVLFTCTRLRNEASWANTLSCHGLLVVAYGLSPGRKVSMCERRALLGFIVFSFNEGRNITATEEEKKRLV